MDEYQYEGDITFCLGDAYAARRLKRTDLADEMEETVSGGN